DCVNHFLWFGCPLYFAPSGWGVVVIFLCIVIFGFASLIKDQCCCFFDGVGFWLVCLFVRFGLFTA
uniref:hypothetical protein n=1 Tax=Corynebacterium striatum TaxID=43770 RepID=UPI00195528BC